MNQEAMEITPSEAAARLRDDPNAVLLDCRTAEEHAAARIESARLVPLGELEARIGELRELDDRTIIVHCHHGVRSLRAVAILRSAGFDRAVSMAGGIDRWSAEVDPGVPRY